MDGRKFAELCRQAARKRAAAGKENREDRHQRSPREQRKREEKAIRALENKRAAENCGLDPDRMSSIGDIIGDPAAEISDTGHGAPAA